MVFYLFSCFKYFNFLTDFSGEEERKKRTARMEIKANEMNKWKRVCCFVNMIRAILNRAQRINVLFKTTSEKNNCCFSTLVIYCALLLSNETATTNNGHERKFSIHTYDNNLICRSRYNSGREKYFVIFYALNVQRRIFLHFSASK